MSQFLRKLFLFQTPDRAHHDKRAAGRQMEMEQPLLGGLLSE